MGDRVHPYVVDGAPIHYPSPLDAHGNQPVQIPADQPIVAHKEQDQQRLLRSNEYNQEGFDRPAAHNYPHRAQRRHRRRCMRCCCCIAAFVGTLVVLLGILVLVLFLVLHPKLPKYTITQANITQFTISNTSSTPASIQADEAGTLILNAKMQFMVSMRNPNKKIGIDYRSLTATLLYEGVEIGEGSIAPFYQGHKNSTHVELPLVGSDVELKPSLGVTLKESLQNDDSLTLHARAITRVRIKIGRWKSHTSKVRVKCRIQISNPTKGNVRLLNNSCKFKLLRLRL